MKFSKNLEVDNDADLSELMTAPAQTVEERIKCDKAATDRRRRIEDMLDKTDKDPLL